MSIYKRRQRATDAKRQALLTKWAIDIALLLGMALALRERQRSLPPTVEFVADYCGETKVLSFSLLASWLCFAWPGGQALCYEQGKFLWGSGACSRAFCQGFSHFISFH